MKKYISLIALVVASGFTASAAYGAIVTSGVVNVAKISVESDPAAAGVGEIYISFSSAPFTTNCSLGSTYWIVGGNPDTVKSVHASALAAKLSGTGVKAVFNNAYTTTTSCSGGGTTGYPILRGLEMQ